MKQIQGLSGFLEQFTFPYESQEFYDNLNDYDFLYEDGDFKLIITINFNIDEPNDACLTVAAGYSKFRNHELEYLDDISNFKEKKFSIWDIKENEIISYINDCR